MKAKSLNTKPVGEAELILNEHGGIYHLGIEPGEVASKIIVVGDPDRVETISMRFDAVETKRRAREFAVHTGRLNGQKITVLSTGIGVDNIDIVLNELDAAVNMDFASRSPKKELQALEIIRVGTSGALRPDIEIGSFVASKYAFGMDSVPFHYDLEMEEDVKELIAAFSEQMSWVAPYPALYGAKGKSELLKNIAHDMTQGITLTANGFYGPQGRNLRLPLRNPSIIRDLNTFEYKGEQMSNFEMECAGLYALGGALGHKMLTCCAILANRYQNRFVDKPQVVVNRLIDVVLERLTHSM